MKNYNITFKGYRLESNTETLPEYSGIYIVYRCKYNESVDKVTLIDIIYIGQTENIKERLNPHSKLEDFKKKCLEDETICYSYASVSLNDLNIVENALIFAQQPELNDKLKDKFNYEETSFKIEGACNLLKYTDFKIS